MSAALAFPDDDFPADHDTAGPHDLRVGGETNSGQATSHSTPSSGAPVRPSIPADQARIDDQVTGVGGVPSSSGQVLSDAHQNPAAAPTSPDPTRSDSTPKQPAPVPATSVPEPTKPPTPPMACSSARAPLPLPSTNRAPATIKPPSTAGDPYVPAPASNAADTRRRAPGPAPQAPPAPAIAHTTPRPAALVLADPLLTLAADVLDDLERVRIANENRLRQLTRTETDADGIDRGFGLPADHPDVARLASLVDGLGKAEHQAELNLNRLMRKHPLGTWVKAARGVGEKQGARLLAAIGDPYWNTLHDRPRTVSELWAFAGFHVLPARHGQRDAQYSPASGAQTGGNPDQAPSDAHRASVGIAAHRARGQRANWSATAKKRGRLVAKSIVKQLVKPCHRPDGQEWADHADDCACSPYRVLYDEARRKYAGSLHKVACRQCGPAGSPAAAGSVRSLAHQEAMALRVVTKAVLRDLWREAKRLHEESES